MRLVIVAVVALASAQAHAKGPSPEEAVRVALVRLDFDKVDHDERGPIQSALRGCLPKTAVDVDLSSTPAISDDRSRIELGKRLFVRLLLEANVWHDVSPDDGKVEWAVRIKVYDAEGGGISLGAQETHCSECTTQKFTAQLAPLVTRVLALDRKEPTTTLAVTTSPPVAAQLKIDGRALGRLPFEERLYIGKHHVEVEADGYQPASTDVVLRKGVPGEVLLTLQPASAPRTDHVNPPRRGHPLRAVGGVLLGLGVAGVAGGGALLAIDKTGTCGRGPMELQCPERYNTLGGGAAFVTVGVLAIVGGIVSLVVDARRGP